MISVTQAARQVLAGILILVCGYALEGKACAQSGPGSQTVILPNPTPRPQDPHALYRDDPVAQARQQQLLALRREQMHARVIADAGNILLLAQQIRDHAVTKDKGPTTLGNDLIGVQQIEKLAKRIREDSKVQ